MDDLISRKATIEGINYLSAFYRANYKKEPPISAIIDGINNMPADKTCEGCVPETIKCKDCKYSERSWYWCKLHNTEVEPESFCSYGEKKDGRIPEESK